MDAYPLFGREKTDLALAKRRNFEQKHPLVVVYWFDASSNSDGWHSMDGPEVKTGAYPVESVGWLVFHDKYGVRLASMAHMDSDVEDSHLSGLHWIPSGMIVDVTTLRGKRPVLEFRGLPRPRKAAKVRRRRPARSSRR